MVDRSWSLTRRLAVTIALVASLLLAMHALWSSWFVLKLVRDEMRGFLSHETTEFLGLVRRQGASVEEMEEATRAMAAAVEEPAFAFRVRRPDGSLISEAGDERLLALIDRPFSPEDSWRGRLVSDSVASSAEVERRTGVTVEVHMDASELLDEVREYLVWASVGLVLSFVAAAFGGWLVARHGLAGLRDVVTRAGDVQIPTQGSRVDLDGAPREVADVGAALNGILDRIDSGMVAMRTFTAGLAHELRSPLQILIGETEVALLSPRSQAEYQELLTSNLVELHALADAVDNLVAYCRTASPRSPVPALERFDLAPEVAVRLSRDIDAAAKVGVRVEVETRGDLRLSADREACLRVLRNLVANAVNVSPADSTVRVLVIGGERAIDMIVEDEGPGVDPELGERIFEPFRSGRTQPGRRSGYGLGLHLCRSAMEQHEGGLRFEGRAEGGSRFIATFPREPEAHAT